MERQEVYTYNAISLLENAAAQAPDKCAVIDEHGSVTYAQLQQLSQAAAAAMVARGLTPGQPVVIMADKSISTLAVMFGALYAGCFYSMIDIDAPAARVQAITGALRKPFVVAADEALERCEQAAAELQVIALSNIIAEAEAQPKPFQPTEEPLDTNLAYVLFTSGSTGTPKGVAVSHRALLGFINTFVDTFQFSEDDIIANQAPFDFDVSVKDIYGALASRATLVLVPRGLFIKPLDLIDFLNEHHVTIMTWAVAALCLVTTFHALDEKQLPTVQKVLFSGEVMPHAHLQEWMSHLPNATFVNLYGPTEVTCNCTYHVLDRARSYAEGIPLGVSFKNREVALLAEDGTPITEPGVEGEIVVRGSCLASGYIGAGEKDANAFASRVWNGFCAEPTYRTGDLAKRNEHGEMIFCGRKDNQIKHMGHRIELEEIEAAFESWEGISRCRCVYVHEKQRLIAFVEGSAENAQIRANMNERLIFAQRPSKIIHIDAMPITKNGKVDRAALLKEATGGK